MLQMLSSMTEQIEIRLATPEISVIIPLTDDRGHGLDCIKSWAQGQTYDWDKYEIIVLVNGSAPELERQVKILLRPHDSLIYHPASNEFLLYDIGARRARGKLLFFTEAHCLAEPDCLAEMMQYFATHLADGARCRSIPADTDKNFLARMEERTFGETFQEAIAEDHWLKFLVHGSAIYRDLYLAEGGLEYEFGQFAEWALAAKLHSQGYRLGYASKPAVRHYYMGRLSDLFLFIRDFTHGEIGYRAKSPADYCEHYFGRAPEWVERESYRPMVARSLFQALLSLLFRDALSSQLKFLLRYGPTALFGLRWHLWLASLTLNFSRLKIWQRRFDTNRCYEAYRAYWQQAIHYCRLEAIADYLASSTPVWPETYQYHPAELPEEHLVGFHAVEAWHGQTFRWSEPVALIQVSLPKGSYEVTIRLLAIRPADLPLCFSIFFDNHHVPIVSTESSGGPISFRLDPTMFADNTGPHHLVLACNPLRPWQFGSTDQRELGLPISQILFRPI